MALDLGGGGARRKPPTRKKPPKRSPLIGREREQAYFKAKNAAIADTARAYSGGGSSGGSGGGGSRSSGGGGGGYYSYGGGGGGGGSSVASARAEEEKRKAAQRKLVEQYYTQGLGSLNQARGAAGPELKRAGGQALSGIGRAYGQNKAATGVTTRDIQSIQRNILAQMQAQQTALGRDLGNQGADTRALASAGAAYQGDARATGAAQDQFNRRLAQVMATGYQDDRASAELVNQSARGQLQANYAQALQALQNARIQSLMGLA
jgi:hypothetical protein